MNNRKAEIKIDGEWREIPFMELKRGDTFRLFEPTGEIVAAGKYTEFVADTDAYLNEEGVGTIGTIDPTNGEGYTEDHK